MPNLVNKKPSSDKFRCLHCPFTGSSKESLRQHEFHHSARLSLQCPFCTFSVSHKIAMTRHMNRVHPEEAAVRKMKKKSIKKKKSEILVTAKIPGSPSPVIISNQSFEDLSIEKGVHHNEDRQFGEDELMKAITNPFNRHMMKLIKAISSFSQVYQEEVNNRPISPISFQNENNARKMSDDALMVDQNPDEEAKKEEMQCKKELNQLANEINACRVEIKKSSKEMESETDLKVEKLRQRMEMLKTTEQGLCNELAELVKQKKRIKQGEKVKTELKLKTDRELFLLKVNQEASDSSSSLKNEKNEKRITKKEKLALKLAKKLKKMEKDVRDLDEHIKAIELKLEENDKNLVELRKDIESLGSLPPSPSPSSSSITDERMTTLKSEVRERIIRFAYLEEHLILLNAKHVIDDIRRKKKEWLYSFGCDDDDEDDDVDDGDQA